MGLSCKIGMHSWEHIASAQAKAQAHSLMTGYVEPDVEVSLEKCSECPIVRGVVRGGGIFQTMDAGYVARMLLRDDPGLKNNAVVAHVATL